MMSATAGSTRRIALSGLQTLLLAGCSPAGSAAVDGSDRESSDGRVDPAAIYYVDQQVERLAEGRNSEREGYLAQLELCNASGAPVRALPETDVQKIGIERWRMWRDGRRLAWRVDAWDLRQPTTPTRETMCQFSLQPAGTHGYVDAGRSINVDLATGERTEGEGDPGVVLAATDGANDPADLALARDKGLQGPQRQVIAGQPCDRWQTGSGGSVCIWAGGTAWGIGSVADGDFFADSAPDPAYIVLSAEPGPGQPGDRIETRSFLLGTPLDEGDMIPVGP